MGEAPAAGDGFCETDLKIHAAEQLGSGFYGVPFLLHDAFLYALKRGTEI